MQVADFEKKIGYVFQNKEYFYNAMRHSSYANEHRMGHFGCNERLEFLGDSVLGFLTAQYLYETFPRKPEGELTKLRAAHVCESALCSYAMQIGLGEMLLLGHGEELGGGRNRSSILADAFEALLAAIYLDGGIDPVKRFLLPLISTHIAAENTDYKTILQERLQQKAGQQLQYVLVDATGPDHDKVFVVEVLIDGRKAGRGTGKSKKEAEQAAAQTALQVL